MDWFRHDLKHALRALLRRPAMSALAIFTLAVGLGVNTVAFSAVNALIFRPFHVPGADAMGWIFSGTQADPIAEASIPTFDAIARDARTLNTVAAEGRSPLALQTGSESAQIWALVITPQYFNLVPPPVVIGRPLTPLDHRPDAVVAVVSERFWRARLNATTDLSAASVILNRQPVSIVGVVRDGYQGPGGIFEPDVWVPLDARRLLSLPADLDAKENGWLTIVAAPMAGVSADAIAHDIRPIVAASTGQPEAALRVQYVPVIDGHPEARAMKPMAAVALTAVGIVLLIACFNVAGLILAQSIDRQRDLGLRSALGATRGRLVRQLLTDGLVLAVLAGAAALLLANWSAALLSTFSLPAPIPQRLHFTTDWRLIGFSMAMSLVAALVPSIMPAWQVWRTDLTRWIRASASSAVGGRASARARRAFLVLQVAGSTVFLILAAAFGRSFLLASSADTGYDTTHTVVMELGATRYGYSAARAQELTSQLIENVKRTPGVTAVSVGDRAPFFVGYPLNMKVNIDGRDCRTADCPNTMVYAVDDAHIAALGLTLAAGRMFDRARAEDRNGVVVTKAAADKFWPGQFPIGREFRDGTGQTWTVTGVVNDVSQRLLRGEPRMPYIYRPITEADFSRSVSIIARTSGDAESLVTPMRAALRDLDPSVPPDSVQTMRARMALPLWPSRTLAGFFGACGLLAMILATVGLFGVTHYVVSQRTREFGVRMAIGASGSVLQRMVISESMRLIAPGLVGGLLLGAALNSLIKAQMMGLEPANARTFVLALLVEIAVAVLAAWIPARRAAQVNPLVALRAD